jgi:hypothetical protein
VLAGFGSYDGSVVAAEFWGAPTRIMSVPPAQPLSHESVMHAAVGDDRLVVFSIAFRPRWFRARDVPVGSMRTVEE